METKPKGNLLKISTGSGKRLNGTGSPKVGRMLSTGTGLLITAGK